MLAYIPYMDPMGNMILNTRGIGSPISFD